MGLPNGVHHLAICTKDIKSQIEFYTQVVGMDLCALYWMHGVDRTFRGFAIGFVLAVTLVYLVMLALFRSFMEPLVILAGVALSLVGVFWGLFLGGSSLNVQSLLGIMMLIGIAVANSIVLVSFAKERLAEGASPIEAVLDAGKTRMRPILMTATATVLGLLPTALHTGMHAEANTPLAQSVIGGLLVATLTTLVVVPLLWVKAVKPHPPKSEPVSAPAALAYANEGSGR